MTRKKGASRFRRIRQIGKGGMACVYKAYDRDLDRFVALKYMAEALVETPEAQALFMTEAKLCAQLSHPHIVTLHDIKVLRRVGKGDRVVLVMEYLEGQTLETLPLPNLKDRFRILRQQANALDYLHGKKIYHLDVKPSNIMVLPDGNSKLLDFGIGKKLEPGQVSLSQAWGTPAHCSPEQLAGGNLTHTTDIFNLGLIAVKLLCESPPESSPGKPFQIPAPRPGVNEHWDATISRVLNENPAERYATAGAFVDDLERCFSSLLSETGDVVVHPISRGPMQQDCLYVEQLNGLQEGNVYAVASGEQITMGRKGAMWLLRDDQFIAPQHCLLWHDGNRLKIRGYKNTRILMKQGRLPSEIWDPVPRFFVLGTTIFGVHEGLSQVQTTLGQVSPFAHFDLARTPLADLARFANTCNFIDTRGLLLCLTQQETVRRLLDEAGLKLFTVREKLVQGPVFADDLSWLNESLDRNQGAYLSPELMVTPRVQQLLGGYQEHHAFPQLVEELLFDTRLNMAQATLGLPRRRSELLSLWQALC